jgi:hypothetical protein
MYKILQIFLICLLVALPVQAAGAAPLSSPRPDDIPESYDLVAENTTFQLYVSAETLAFKLVDKRSGYIWSSNLDERAENDRLNKTWTAFAQSGISIDYLDQKANSKRASISNAEHSLEVQPIENGIRVQVTFIEPNISIGILLQLEETGVRVEVPFESIQENGEFRLQMFHLYPWMGATRQDQVSGYMFIPDGCGSLIHFAAETKAENMYYGRYYGSDLGMLASMSYNPTIRRPYPISIPVIGMVHGEGQNAYLAVLEQGASYAEIQAHPAGIITNFNFIYNAFIYNESYFQQTNRAGDGVTVIQPQTNHYDIVVHYRFLTGPEADYVGMARSFQQYLLDKGFLHEQVSGDDSTDIGIRLEFLGAEQEKILFWNRTIPMTTLAQMEQILGDLEISNSQVVFYGWQPGGASAMPPDRVKLDSKLGSLSELEALVEAITSRGGTFGLYFDPLAALMSERSSISRYDLAMAITNTYIEGYLRGKRNYYFDVPAIEERFSSFRRDVQERLQAGIALDNIGSILYSDFRRGQSLNRGETIAAYQNLLAQSESPVSFYVPNDYLFGYAAAYYDIPMSNSGYTYTTDVVPFLQIVLSGYVPYYGEALNFSPDVRGDLLRHAEFGVYPSFFVTYEDTARILNTRSNWIYVSSYRQLGTEIEESYAWLNALLGPVQGASIMGHEEISPDVFATTYDNGKQIIVNYRDHPFTVYGITINAQDAVLREVTP